MSKTKSKSRRRPPRLDAPENYINRELSWLEFNARVLHEARRRDNPLLERLKFLGIVSSNLDEFYMVRVGGLLQALAAGSTRRCPAGLAPGEQLAEIARRAHEMVALQARLLRTEILPGLAEEGVRLLRVADLDRRELAAVERVFDEELFPGLTPVAIPEDGELPRLAGLTLHLLLTLRRPGERAPRHAVLPLPRGWARAIRVPAPRGFRFVLAEDAVAHFADRLFPGHKVAESAPFRITRDADIAVDDEDACDLLEAMAGVLRARKEGAPVRLELADAVSRETAVRLAAAFPIAPEHTFRVAGPLDMKPFIRLAGQIEGKGLRYPSFVPSPAELPGGGDDLFAAVAAGDLVLHHPYDAFDPVVEMVSRAADDPQVTAIKQTLYRTSEDSPIIAALERAAARGKQVAVLVELKARFDEERNIDWARRLSDAGAQVVYGVAGLKTHAKALLVVRRERDGGVRRFVHLSTGNYNDQTARLYEDVGLFTASPDIGADVANFFNAVTGYSEPREWRALAVAPTGLRPRLEELIDREISRSTREAPGRITMKMNSLVDPGLIARLYAASQAGVRVRLCVRGICCLRPGVPGLSERIEVRSIVDRFLEHSRVFRFRNGGEREIYLSSADLMPRNLDRRVEILFPVLDERHRKRLDGILDNAFADNVRAWSLGPDGAYTPLAPAKKEKPHRAQEALIEEAHRRAEEVERRRLAIFRPKGPGKAPGQP